MQLSRLRSSALLALATAVVLAPLAPLAVAAPASAQEGSPALPASGLLGQVTELELPDLAVDPGYDGPTTPLVRLAPRSGTTGSAASRAADPFTLHSSPGAQRTIYLDFDGTTALGSKWRSTGSQPGWSLDADPAFSDKESAAIQDVWALVAEDFAPFEVDVTTQDPGQAAITRTGSTDQVFGTRVLVTGSGRAPSSTPTRECGSQCGGIAWIDVFDNPTEHAAYQPAMVFPQNLGDDPKAIADAASHEAGHTLGLQHQGTKAHDNAAAAEYHTSSGLWGPIMGSPYESPLSQWSRSDYPNAGRQQDDLAVAAAGGLPLRNDVVGGTVSSAVTLPVPAGTPASTGVLESAGDVDVFALGTCTGMVGVRADPAATPGPDLDLSLTLLDRDGRVLTSANPAAARSSRASASGLGATVSHLSGRDVPLYAAVDGVGSSASSDYGSLGRYRLSVTGCASDPAAAGTPRSLSADVTTPGTAALTWSAPATGTVAGYTVTATPGGAATELPASATSTSFSGLRPGTSYTFTVTTRDASGNRSSPAVVSTVLPAQAPGSVASLGVSAIPDGRVEVRWTPPSEDGGATPTGYLLQVGSLSQVYPANTRSVMVSGLAPGTTYTASVSAQNDAGTGPVSSQGITLQGTAPAATSHPVRPDLRPVSKSARRGSPEVGSRISVRAGTWSAPVQTRYRWLVDGRAVAGAKGSSITVRPAWAGRRISVQLSVTASGYDAVKATVSWGRV